MFLHDDDIDKLSSLQLNEIQETFMVDVLSITDINNKQNVVNYNLCSSIEQINRILGRVKYTLMFKDNDCDEEIKNKLLGNLQNCIYILDSLISFSDHLVKLSITTVSCYTDFPKSIVQILFLLFDHCQNCEKTYSVYLNDVTTSIKYIFQRCDKLQRTYFSILTEKIELDVSQEVHLSLLLDVLSVVVNIGEIVNQLDIKTMAEVWKGFINICVKYADYIEDEYVHHNATKVLCAAVKKRLFELIFKEEFDTKAISRSSKIVNFMIKILHKISELCNGCVSKNTEHLISYLVFIYQNSPSYLKTLNLRPSLVEAVGTHVSIGTEQFLLELISNEYFIIGFVNNIITLSSDDSNKFGCLFLTITIISLLTNSSQRVRSMWLEENDVVCLLFDVIPQCNKEMLINVKLECSPVKYVSIYDYAVIYASCLTISCNNIDVIEKKMLQCILTSDVWTATLACDIWLTIVRYGTSDLCLGQVECLIEVYQKLSKMKMFKKTTQEVYLSHLLNKLFKLLPKRSKIHLLDKYSVSSHTNLWTVFGLHNLPDEYVMIESEKAILHSNKMSEEFLSLNESVSKTVFIKMAESFELLTTVPFLKLSLENKYECFNIMKIWDLVITSDSSYLSKLESSVAGSQWFYDFILLLIKLSIGVRNQLNNKNLFSILVTLSSQLRNVTSLVKIGVLNLLQIFVDYEISDDEYGSKLIALISSLFGTLLGDENILVRSISLETFLYFAVTTTNVKIITNVKTKDISSRLINFLGGKETDNDVALQNMYLQNFQHSSSFIHKCKIIQNFDKPLCDKTVDEEGDRDCETQLWSAIDCVKTNMCSLKNLCKTGRLNLEQKHELKILRDVINELLNKNGC